MIKDRRSLRSIKDNARRTMAMVSHSSLGFAVRNAPIPVRGFFILAQGRTGSSLLSDLLASHPKVRSEGELLLSPVRYPEAYLFGRAARFSALGKLWGFKAKSYQMRASMNGRERDFMLDLQKRNWKVVYLRRENFLASALSTIIGMQRSKFQYHLDEKRAFPSITIDPLEFRNHLAGRQVQNEDDRYLLQDIDFFELIYERDLADGGDAARLRDLQAYLKLPGRQLSSKYRKTEERHVSEYVSNWKELRRIAVEMGLEGLVSETFGE